MKKLLSFVAVLAMALVVAAPCAAKAGTYYFDNTATGWDYVSVWSWSVDDADPLYQMSNELTGWPGAELSKDDATGYYVWENVDPASGAICVMFNNGNVDNAPTEQTCDALAEAGVDGKVCVPTVKNTADDEAADAKRKADQWYGEWKEVGAADAETPDAETPDAETPDAETPDAETPEVTPDAGKDEAPQTGDVAPIAAVAVLAVASMAVVVATRKKMA